VGQDAALAVEDIARVTLTALHAVVVAVALQADCSAAGLADAHTTLIVAVGGAGDRWNRRDKSGLAQSQGAGNRFLATLAQGDGGVG
jgi:hypothetical protein